MNHFESSMFVIDGLERANGRPAHWIIGPRTHTHTHARAHTRTQEKRGKKSQSSNELSALWKSGGCRRGSVARWWRCGVSRMTLITHIDGPQWESGGGDRTMRSPTRGVKHRRFFNAFAAAADDGCGLYPPPTNTHRTSIERNRSHHFNGEPTVLLGPPSIHSGGNRSHHFKSSSPIVDALARWGGSFRDNPLLRPPLWYYPNRLLFNSFVH